MTTEQQSPNKPSLTTIHPFLVEVWEDKSRGLRKEITNFKFITLTKATEISKCCVSISHIYGLQEHHESVHLQNGDQFEYWISLGDAVTPIDCYIDVFLQEMLVGETSNCSLQTKSGESISFQLNIMKINFGGYVFELSTEDIIRLAQKYKDNGVKMFKKYPTFAQAYFNRAAKCLISCLPFNTLKDQNPEDEPLDPAKLERMLENIYMNIAACLIKQNRFDEALHVLRFTDREKNVPEKALYRRALAHFKYGQLDDAKNTLERFNYKDSKESLALYNDILVKWKVSNQNYSNMVKKMFG